MKACSLGFFENNMCLIGTVFNGHREGANPSSCIIVLPDLEFPNQSRRPVSLCLN